MLGRNRRGMSFRGHFRARISARRPAQPKAQHSPRRFLPGKSRPGNYRGHFRRRPPFRAQGFGAPHYPVPLRLAVLPAAAFTLVLWLVHLTSEFLLPSAASAGIYPRRAEGLPGIFFAPLLHASFDHLISNTLPLLLLGGGMLYFYPRASKIALPFLYLAPGAGVWLFARGAWHLGASGLSYGIMFFVLSAGFLRKDKVAAGFSTAALFLYGGGMLTGLLPEDSGVSFEYHLFGALTGVLCAFALRRRDPLPPPPKSPAENAEEEEDDIIGDQWKLPR